MGYSDIDSLLKEEVTITRGNVCIENPDLQIKHLPHFTSC
jgi:hypothetical protein